MNIVMLYVYAADHISSHLTKNPSVQCAPLASIFEDMGGLKNGIVECQLQGSPRPTETLIFRDSPIPRNILIHSCNLR